MALRFRFVEMMSLFILMVHLLAIPANQTLNTTTASNSSVTAADILKEQREKIVQEMESLINEKGFENLTVLTPETHGIPFRNIIVTTWRSGSTFLGGILNSMPGNFYHFEPLVNYGIQVIRGPPHDEQAIYQIKQLLHCNYTNLKDYVHFGAKHKFVFNYNSRLWEHCILHPGHPKRQVNVTEVDANNPRYCSDANFLSSFCKLFPLQSMKVLRIRLTLAEQLLEDDNLNVRIVFLVRDPRALMTSRSQCKWCRGNADCERTTVVCDDMTFNYYAAQSFQTKYPHRFKIVRYEELSLRPFNMTEEILNFYGLPFDEMVVNYLESHTKENIGNIYSTFRNSSATPFRWMYNRTFDEIDDIQDHCSKAMELWGYRRMSRQDFHNDFNPLLEWPYSS